MCSLGGATWQATVELPGIKGMWSLRASSSAAFDTYLIVTFIRETRVLAMNAEEELDETEIAGFEADAQTLFCGNCAHDQLVQVTAGSVRLVSNAAQTATWQPPLGRAINVGTANATQVGRGWE